jgi:outer membrane protein assembly factor BamB
MDTHHSLLRLGAYALLGAIALPLAGCSSTQTVDDNDPLETIETPAASWSIDHESFRELGYRWDWSGFPPLQRNAELMHAQAHHDVVITLGSGATLSVMDAKTGKIKWSKQVDRPITSFFEPVRFGQTLYVNSETNLYEINLKNGNTIDEDRLGAIVSTSPAIMDNIAIFGTTAGNLFGFQMDQDFKLWSYKFDGPIHTKALELDDEFVAAISDGGDIRTIRAKSAESGAVMRIAKGARTDLLTDGVALFAASTDQSIYSFAIEDGFRYWRQRSSAPITVQPVLHDGVLYASMDDTGLAAMDAATGQINWNNNEIMGWPVALLEGSELIVWTGYELVSMDSERGDILSRISLPYAAGVRTDMFEDGNLYIVTRDGRIAKFSPR